MFIRIFRDTNLIELLKGSSISLVIRLFGMMLGYVSMLCITNIYGAELWGVYSIFITLLSILIVFPKFGFDISLVRIITELNLINDGKKEILHVIRRVLLVSMILSIIISIAISLIPDSSYEMLGVDSIYIEELKILRIAFIPMVLLLIFSAVFQALKKIALFTFFQATLINFFFLIVLLIDNLWGMDISIIKLYTFSTVCSMIIGAITLKNTLKKLSTEKSKPNLQYGYKRIVNISFPMLMSSSFALMMGWADLLMISYYFSPTEVGIYNSAFKLATLSNVFLIAINSIATPKFVEFYSQNDIPSLRKTVQSSTKLIFIVSVPLLLCLVFFSKTIMNLFGDEFTIGYSVLIYLCISRFVNAISGSVGYIMQMTDQQKVFQNVLLIALILNIVLNFLLIPRYGINGAAIASTIAMIFWNLTLVLLIKKKLGFWTFMSINLRKF